MKVFIIVRVHCGSVCEPEVYTNEYRAKGRYYKLQSEMDPEKDDLGIFERDTDENEQGEIEWQSE